MSDPIEKTDPSNTLPAASGEIVSETPETQTDPTAQVSEKSAPKIFGRPFQKGHTGNPIGGPRGPRLLTRLAKFGRWKTPQDFKDAILKKFPDYRSTIDGLKVEDAAMLRLWLAALSGEPRAIQEILDRSAGKAKQAIDLGNPDGSLRQAPVINVCSQQSADLINKLTDGSPAVTPEAGPQQ